MSDGDLQHSWQKASLSANLLADCSCPAVVPDPCRQLQSELLGLGRRQAFKMLLLLKKDKSEAERQK